tara:strand:- start:1934 stop:2104 length:171 start_codon:yes stop_codon:yes gene_type:complete
MPDRSIQITEEGSGHPRKFSKGEIGEFKEKLDKLLIKRGLKDNQRSFKYGNKKKKD